MSYSLLDWLDEPRTGKGLYSLDPRGSWQFTSYHELAQRVHELSAHFQSHALPMGSVVAIALGSGIDFTAAFFAALHAGATPCPIVPPLPFQRAEAYRDHVRRLFAVAKPQLLVTTQSLHRQIGMDGRSGTVTVDGKIAGGNASRREQAPHALLQFTSGSSGRPKAVRVSHDALARNVMAIRTWLRMTPDDVTPTWLPVHHDMGLIGCLLTPVANRSDVRLMQPGQFLRDPLAWLECFGRFGGTLTSVPDFALSYVAQRVSPESLAGMDFRHWRVVIVGAERIRAQSLDRFAALLGPHGFRRQAYCPAYGLAEASLAVTGLPVDHEPTVVRMAGERSLGTPVVPVPDGTDYVGCGMPLGDTEIEILDDMRRPLPDGFLGEIRVRSSMIADGYLGAPPDDDTFVAAGLRTGDAGFLLDGQLFVAGRLGDSIKHRARAIFAEELEAALHEIGAGLARPVVLLGSRSGSDTAVVLLEPVLHSRQDEIAPIVGKLVPGLPVHVSLVTGRAILRTSSGKPRRREMWQRFVAEQSAVDVVRQG